MIKITTQENKELFLWLSAEEVGKSNIGVDITISESEVDAKKNMEAITEHYFHKKLEIPTHINFDGSEKLNEQGVNENPLTTTVMSILEGNTVFRTGYHNLVLDVLNENELISSAVIVL